MVTKSVSGRCVISVCVGYLLWEDGQRWHRKYCSLVNHLLVIGDSPEDDQGTTVLLNGASVSRKVESCDKQLCFSLQLTGKRVSLDCTCTGDSCRPRSNGDAVCRIQRRRVPQVVDDTGAGDTVCTPGRLQRVLITGRRAIRGGSLVLLLATLPVTL